MFRIASTIFTKLLCWLCLGKSHGEKIPFPHDKCTECEKHESVYESKNVHELQKEYVNGKNYANDKKSMLM